MLDTPLYPDWPMRDRPAFTGVGRELYSNGPDYLPSVGTIADTTGTSTTHPGHDNMHCLDPIRCDVPRHRGQHQT